MNLTVFAERLSELIFENDTPKENIFSDLKISKSTLYEYLSGCKMPSLKNFIKLIEYFNCSADFLIGLEDENFISSYLPIKPFSERLCELLKFFNLSRYKLKNITGHSESTLYYWSKGKTSPSLENLVEICKKLNCSLDFLLGRTELP